MNPAYDFQGQVALVTGAGSGMGLATVKAFAAAGAAVVLADADEEALKATTESLAAASRQVLGVTCDVAEEAQVGAMVEQAVSVFGRLGRSDEIATAVPWLCSPGASFVLGVGLAVDGGFAAH